MGYFASNHRRPQPSLRTVVGWFDLRMLQKQKDPAPVMLESNAVEQALVVIVTEHLITQVIGQFLVQFPPLTLILIQADSPLAMILPQLQSFTQDGLELLRKAAGPSPFALLDRAGVFEQMAQALLLGDPLEDGGVITFAAIRPEQAPKTDA
jgi:hypothetical protein